MNLINICRDDDDGGSHANDEWFPVDKAYGTDTIYNLHIHQMLVSVIKHPVER